MEVSRFTYTEFLDYTQNSKRASSADSSDRQNSDKTEWTKTKSFQEAMNLARYWWDAWIKEIEEVMDWIEILWNAEVTYDVSWWFVDVWRHISWQPDSMMQFTDIIPREIERLTIAINFWYCWRVSSKKAMIFLKKALWIIVKHHKSYDMRIVWVLKTEQDDDVIDYTEVIIKDFWQNIVLNSFAFAFHPSFFRRLWFKYIETKEYHDELWYGSNRKIKEEELRENFFWKIWYIASVEDIWENFSEEDILKL